MRLQMAAIKGLREMHPVTNGIVNALRAAMESESLFCRVRMDAAMALAAAAGTDFNGVHLGLLCGGMSVATAATRSVRTVSSSLPFQACNA